MSCLPHEGMTTPYPSRPVFSREKSRLTIEKSNGMSYEPFIKLLLFTFVPLRKMMKYILLSLTLFSLPSMLPLEAAADQFLVDRGKGLLTTKKSRSVGRKALTQQRPNRLILAAVAGGLTLCALGIGYIWLNKNDTEKKPDDPELLKITSYTYIMKFAAKGKIIRTKYSYSDTKFFEKACGKVGCKMNEFLCMNAANSTAYYRGGGTNQYLSWQVAYGDGMTKEKYDARGRENGSGERKHWGTFVDRDGKPWGEKKIGVGNFVLSKKAYKKEDGQGNYIHIMHFEGPDMRVSGLVQPRLDKLREGMTAAYTHLFSRTDYKALSAVGVSAGIFGNGHKQGAYVADLQGLDNALKKYEEENPGKNIPIYILLNWFDIPDSKTKSTYIDWSGSDVLKKIVTE